jgi:putative transposase
LQGEHWLGDERVATILAEEIHRLDGESYRLLAYTIMPNHVHLLIDISDFRRKSPSYSEGITRNYPVTEILRLLKGRTARYCNQALGKADPFGIMKVMTM